MEKVVGSRCFHPDLLQGSLDWHACRTTCDLTASEVGTAIGIGYASRASLIRVKLGVDEPEPENEYMQFGRDYESLVAEAYEGALHVKTDTFGFATLELPCGLKLGASPDRLYTQRLVEIKCSKKERMEPHPAHLAQMLIQSVIFDIPEVDYVCWSPSQVDPEDNCMILKIARVRFDPRLWTDHVLPALQYYKRLVANQTTAMVKTHEKKQMLAAFAKYTIITPLY